MVQINWTEQAKTDLKEIADYISIDSVKYAQYQILRIISAAKNLKNFARLGKIVPEIRDSKIRELVTGNYRIIYLIVNDRRIDILTIHHSARDLSKRKIKNQ